MAEDWDESREIDHAQRMAQPDPQRYSAKGRHARTEYADAAAENARRNRKARWNDSITARSSG